MSPSHPLPPELLDLPVRGGGRPDESLGAALAPAPTLLVFLRHFG